MDEAVASRLHGRIQSEEKIKSGFIMPIRILGKALFPRQQAWQRERKIKHILVAIAVASLFAATAAFVMFTSNARTH